MTVESTRPAAASNDASITSLAVYPPAIQLNTKLARQQFIVVATRRDGVTLEVTKQTAATLANSKLARIEGATLYPVADGQTTLQLKYLGQDVAVPVDVKNAAADRPISFKLDVMPVFTRTGCNTGSCHGAARGKDGFRISLFGFDPDGDYTRLTREIGFRRINLALPRDSLLLEKSVGHVPHTGGKRFDEASEYYQTVLRWLEAGAPKDPVEPAACVKVELFPPAAVLEGAGATQQFIVRATYADGTQRDVTNLAVFLTNNDNSAPINPQGLVTAANRGEAFVMARFGTHTVGSQVLVLPKDLKFTPAPIAGSYIDQLVLTKLNKIRVEPSGICSDEEFLRRASIDITGLLPTAAEYEAFVSDPSADKRAKLVDRLLQRKEFSEIWAMKWAELLMIKSNNDVSYKAMLLYYTWLTDKIAGNVPLDEMVRELLSANGGTFRNPATNYYQTERDTLKVAENVAQQFMGIRTQCCQCHNHPFDRWTMNDYYSFAAFFSQIGRKQAEDYRETVIFNSGGGEVSHPVTGKVMPPKFLGGPVADVAGKDRRTVMAEWLTSPENPYFSTSIANRVWSHFFGRGIIEPVDDIRVSNPASNPELFQALGKKLIEYKYDFKHLVRDICNSQTYQRSSQRNASNEHDEANFAHAIVRRIPAETLLDCISEVTETKDKFQGLPLGSRAVQIADGRTSDYFLTTFGRAPRDTVCAAEAKTEPTLSQALHLLNGPTVQSKISQGGIVKRMLDQKLPARSVIEAIYVRCLARKPTPDESQKLSAIVAQAENPQAGLEDVFWAVLNSREFLFNH
ncbi:MAG TPA: DUF1549 and DUF1553 domain-containing protein [Pirellulales bacterium]|nr:DUF1549 and DUF1553 domain-containing protein [Pirellulales bacterium]